MRTASDPREAAAEAFEFAHYQQCVQTERLRTEAAELRLISRQQLLKIASLEAMVVKMEGTERDLRRALSTAQLELREAREEISERNCEINAISVRHAGSAEAAQAADRLWEARRQDAEQRSSEESAELRRQLVASEYEIRSMAQRLAAESAHSKALQQELDLSNKEANSMRQQVLTFLDLDVKRCLQLVPRVDDGSEPCGIPFNTASAIAEQLRSSAPDHLLLSTIAGLPPDGRRFEQFCCELFRLRGHRVSHCGQAADGGIDFIVVVDSVSGGKGTKYVGQCKLYNGKIGTGTVREFCGAMVAAHCPNGILITSSSFSRAAWELVAALQREHSIDIDLWDSDRIRMEAAPVTDALLQFLGVSAPAHRLEQDLADDASEEPEINHLCDEVSRNCAEAQTLPENASLSTINEKKNVASTPDKARAVGLQPPRSAVGSADVWSAAEMAALRLLVAQYREKAPSIGSPGGRTPGRARADGEGRIPWGVICGHIKSEGSKGVFGENHVTKEKLRSKWKNMMKADQTLQI